MRTAAVVSLGIFITALAAVAEAPEKENKDSLEAWRDARFGMFIHWGPVSLKETEISWSRANSNPKCPNNGQIPVAEYDNLYKGFNPTNFNAREWVAIAKAAGMKYMVLTAKHCDGFLLWDSKVDDYNIMHTPFKRDVCAELAKAAHKAGIKIGWYFSPMDWRDPDFRTERNTVFIGRMQGEIRELLSNYGRIDVLWFDWDGREPVYDQAGTYALVRKLQPKILLTNRLDLGPGNSDRQILSTNADYYTPEQSVGGYDDQRRWESCMTISKRGQWAWGGHADGVKTFEECIKMLINCAGGDGNMLLNVGPEPSGEIAPEQVDRLKEMGSWLVKYGKSIYGTRGGPFKPGKYGVSTRRGNTIYLHILNWPGDSLELRDIPAKVVRNTVLTGGSATITQSNGCLTVSIPASNRANPDTIVALEIDQSAAGITALDPKLPSQPSLSSGKKAMASNVFQGNNQYSADKAFDDNDETRWATDGGTKSAWLEVDLGKPESVGHAVIEQAFPELHRVRKFAIQYLQGDEWKSCYQGENLDATLNAAFSPVNAQKFRLNITESTDGPTIWEFKLFPPKN